MSPNRAVSSLSACQTAGTSNHSIRRGLSLWRIQRWAIDVAPGPVAPLASAKDNRAQRGGEGRCVWKVSPLSQSDVCGQIGQSWLTNEVIAEAGSVLRVFGLLWAENMQSMGQNSLCARYKTPTPTCGGYLYQGFCACFIDRLALRPCMASVFCYQVKMYACARVKSVGCSCICLFTCI